MTTKERATATAAARATAKVDSYGMTTKGQGSLAGYPVTPDGRYFVVRGRLWRCSDPGLGAEERERLVRELMEARRAKGVARRAGDGVGREAARQRVDVAKHGLGERGAVWWEDGAPDYNRRMVKNTPYAEWFAGLGEAVVGE